MFFVSELLYRSQLEVVASMNILFVDQFAQMGGAQRCLLDLIPAFRQKGWNLRFAIAAEGPLTEELSRRRMRLNQLPECPLSSLHKPPYEHFRYAMWYSKATLKLCEIADEFRPDLVYVNGPRVLPPAALMTRRRRTPLLFHAHNRVLQSSALRVLGAHIKLGRSRVIACCRHVADSLRPYLANVETVYNGVSDLCARPWFRREQNPLIGIIGRVEPEKGQLEFVRAARLVHSVWPTSRFVVIGAPISRQGPPGAYFRATQEESGGLPVSFAGWQSDIREVLRALDVVVVPSFAHEATPRVVIEAFSAGVPVVAFSSGGIPELIDDGRTGFLVHTRSPEALANRLLDVLSSEEESITNVVRNARQKWRTDFSLDMYQRRVCNIIEESVYGMSGVNDRNICAPVS
jgi:glycosyltransferase involved in cell wall biosynthesis